MEIWGPKLPSGWRYPCGRRKIKQALGDIPDIQVHFDQRWSASFRSPQENKKPVVATARMRRSVHSFPWNPRVALYGWRETEYPDAASEDFLQNVVPNIYKFLLDQLELAKLEIAPSLGRQIIEVQWANDHHEIKILDTKRDW